MVLSRRLSVQASVRLCATGAPQADEAGAGREGQPEGPRPAEAPPGEERLAGAEDTREAHRHKPKEQGLQGPTSGPNPLSFTVPQTAPKELLYKPGWYGSTPLGAKGNTKTTVSAFKELTNNSVIQGRMR